MTRRRHLLWVDGLAALAVGIGVVVFAGWLSDVYGVPRGLLFFTGVMNLVYSSYSLSLAARRVRPKRMIVSLIIANSAWGMICLVLVGLYRDTATVFGFAHLGGEALFVAGLAALEWRWREHLLMAGPR